MTDFQHWLNELEKKYPNLTFPCHVKQSTDITSKIQIGPRLVKIDFYNTSQIGVYRFSKAISKII